MPNYLWPEQGKRRLMGTRISRIDGGEKSSGRAKYGSDLQKPGLLHAAMLTCPHAHARVSSIDVSEAKAMKGVTAVRVISPAGTEIQWAGTEVAMVAADREETAQDAVKKIKVAYEPMAHLVSEEDLKKAGPRAKAAGEQITGDPEQALKEAEVVSEGYYGIPVITHCCLESHGQVSQWNSDDTITLWPSTQNVSGIGGDLAKSLELPATKINVHQDHMGGGFGSKFASDRWGVEGTRLSKDSGGKPVKAFLDRKTELTIAGVRPSCFGNVKMAAKKDGTITLWQSDTWATGGIQGGGSPPIPYVFTGIPNQRKNHTAIATNTGGARAWRAPNHQQACYMTSCAIDDLAHKLGMDPLEVYLKNADMTPRGAVYRAQLQKAAEMMEWKTKWHPRGQTAGPVKKGVGLAIHTWQGGGHASKCRTRIHPDGSVEVELGSQDLGTGTRTAIAIVVAETLGLQVNQVKVRIGDNSYPPSGASGGSTTIGGVGSSSRKSSVNALDKLLDAVAPSLGVPKDQLEAVDGRIQQKGNATKSMPWKQACAKLGAKVIEEMGENDPKNPMGLMSAGVGGVQMAEVAVDTETGIVKMIKTVAVQDCGTIINLKTAESQVYGGCIMNIGGALHEERILDQQTGRMLNADMEFYKLVGIGDIGEIVVHMNVDPEHDKRGIIGLGEPPAIGLLAAIANAVTNAIGVRPPRVPLTPERILAALEGRNA